MRVCLLPLKIEPRNPAENLRHFEQRLQEIAPHQPDLVCLPECAFTGYLYEEAHLARFAEPIPGEMTEAISNLARSYRSYLCFGMLERALQGFYSSAVLVDKMGQVVLVQRKISEQPPFATGNEVHVAHTEFGWVSILICGDLFDDTVKSRIDPRTQCLLVPMARSFEGKSPHLDRWLKEERQAYLEEVKKTGLLTLMVNLLEDAKVPEAAFGGALIVREDGEILAESPHGSDQALIFDLMPLDRERRYNPSQPKQ